MNEIEKKYSIYLLDTGLTVVFDTKGEQIPALQVPWLIRLIQQFEAAGINPLECEFRMPDRSTIELFKVDKENNVWGWNWRVKR